MELTLEEIYNILKEEHYPELREPRGGGEYITGEDETILGKNIWIHSNRSNRDEARNGLIGLYSTNSKGNRKERLNYYTNEIRLVDAYFQVPSEKTLHSLNTKDLKSDGSANRKLVAGISGKVSPLVDNFGGESINYDNVRGVFYLMNDRDSIVLDADEVYMKGYSVDGKIGWEIKAKGVKLGDDRGQYRTHITEDV